jgi:hypothetical protein
MFHIKIKDAHVALLSQQLAHSGEYTTDSSTPGYLIYGTEEPGVFSRWCRAYEEAGAPFTVV